MRTRNTVFHDMFYPASSEKLSEMIDGFFKEVKKSHPIPKAIIAPHAGYIYSGLSAAYAFKCLLRTTKIKKVVVVAPSHQCNFDGLAVTDVEYFQTPLGKISIDRKICEQLINNFDNVKIEERAFDHEHALEVELPFLQKALGLGYFDLIPLIVGNVTADDLSKVLLSIWNGPEILFVISSDLSHYHSYAIASKIDYATKEAIENLLPDKIAFGQACGQTGILALLQIAKQKHLKARCVDLRNSGDTAGDRDRVVGYGAFHFYEDK